MLLRRPLTRPSSRAVGGEATLALVVREAARGAEVTVLAGAPEAEAAAARLMRVVQLLSSAKPGGLPLAVRLGERVYLCDAGVVRAYPASRFAHRPRRCVFADTERPHPAPARGGLLPSIDAFVRAEGDAHARITYVDGTGTRLDEVVPQRILEQHLAETSALLRALPSPALLSVRTGLDLSHLVGRRDPVAGFETDARVRVRWPLSLSVELSGEKFGSGHLMGLSAAAEWALAGWPRGAQGRVRVNAVTLEVPQQARTPLFHLYARSWASRRLAARLKRLRA